MAQIGRAALKAYFETGDIPTEAQFIDLIDSCKIQSKNNTFTPAIVFDVDLKYFNQYTQSGALAITLDSNTNGAASYAYVAIETDGNSISFPPTWREINNDYADDGAIYALIVFYDGSEYQYWIYKIRIIDVAAPVLSSQTIEDSTPTALDLVFDEIVVISITGWTINTDGAALSISSVSGSGTTIPIFTLSRAVTQGESITLDYNSAVGDTTDVYSNELVTFSDAIILNKVGGFTIEAITVIDNVGLTVTAGTGLQKEAENTGWNTGCASDQQINSGEGWIEFTLRMVDKANTQTLYGMSHTNPDEGVSTVEFSLFFANSVMYSRESGSNNVISEPFVDGDKFRIRHNSAVITYEKWNGSSWDIIRTSGVTPTLPLMFDCSMSVDGILNANHVRVEDVKIAGYDIV